MVYVLTFLLLASAISVWITDDDSKVIKRSFITNIIMSCFLAMIGDLVIFFPLVFLNLFLFITGNMVTLRKKKRERLKKERRGIFANVISWASVGVVIFTIFENIDFFNFEQSQRFKYISVGNLKEYVGLICIISAVTMMVILFLDRRILKK